MLPPVTSELLSEAIKWLLVFGPPEIRENLRIHRTKDYEMVEKQGPDTMQIQIAVTHGEKSNVGLATVSKIVPQARMLDTLWSFASGKPAFTGEVSIEYKVTDAQTGELLAAGADERVGGLKLFDKTAFGSWGDVKNSFSFWGDFTVYRLCQLREGSDCVEPKA